MATITKHNMEPKFKEGTWIFCEFELQQVKETEDNRITSVTSGQFNLSGHDLSDRCVEINLRTKLASDHCQYWNRQFHDAKCTNALNHPDLNRALIERWVAICDEPNDKKRQVLYDKLSEFGRAVLEKVRTTMFQEVDGISVFR